MKKTLVAAILGVATVVSSYAQGKVNLDTYNTSPFPLITYGANSGGTLNADVTASPLYTVGFYWIVGNGTGSVAADPSGFALISAIAPTFALASGVGATTTINTGGSGAGWFSSSSDYTFAGVASGQVTMIMVAYNGLTYDSSSVRGHSSAFLITPSQGLATPPGVGTVMNGFQVIGVPEPSTFALAGLGLAGLLIFRRRN